MSDDRIARRERNTKSAARRRATQLARANAGATFCQHRLGSYQCNGRLEDRVDRALGIVTRICPKCERRKQGICERCPLPVYGTVPRATRCLTHFRQARRDAVRRSQAEHHEERLAAARDRLRSLSPEARARRLEYKRAYRKAHPEKIRAQKRRYSLKQSRHNLEWHKKYNARRRQAKADAMREQYRADNPIPQPRCVKCERDIPWFGRTEGAGRPPLQCVFCMDKYKLRASLKRWVAKTDRELAAPAAPIKKVRPWKPKFPTPVNAAGERLCLTPGCTVTCTGRRKKCEPCLADDQRVAREILARTNGRGRRTDLERAS